MLRLQVKRCYLLTLRKTVCYFSGLLLIFPQVHAALAKESKDFEIDKSPSRKGKTLGLYFTTGYSPQISVGGLGSYFIFPDVLAELGFEYMTYSSDYIGNGRHFRIPLTGRWFFWNNFSCSGGIALDSISEDRYVPVLANTATLGVMHAHRLALEVEIHIGNRWILWEGFTLGFDWFGVATPALEIRKKFSSFEYLRPDSEKTSQDKFSHAVEQHSLHFFKVVAGWAF